jgi:hypothetical protein
MPDGPANEPDDADNLGAGFYRAAPRILRLARHVNGNHWHAYLPVARGHAQAHPICAPLSDVAERMAASRWLIEYDRRVDAGGT